MSSVGARGLQILRKSKVPRVLTSLQRACGPWCYTSVRHTFISGRMARVEFEVK